MGDRTRKMLGYLTNVETGQGGTTLTFFVSDAVPSAAAFMRIGNELGNEFAIQLTREKLPPPWRDVPGNE